MPNVIFLQISGNVGNVRVRPLFSKPCMFEEAGVGLWLCQVPEVLTTQTWPCRVKNLWFGAIGEWLGETYTHTDKHSKAWGKNGGLGIQT